MIKIIGGLKITNGGGGTLGCVVYDKNTNKPVGLSNRHVLHKKKGSSVYIYNDAGEKFKIGKVLRKGGLRKRNDFAIFSLNENTEYDKINSFNDLEGKLTEYIKPEIGMKVTKIGQKTGRTYGIIKSINYKKKYITIIPNPEKFDEEISMKGDSGAIWVTDEPNFKAVGLHRGGENEHSDNERAFAIPMKRVLNKIKIKIKNN